MKTFIQVRDYRSSGLNFDMFCTNNLSDYFARVHAAVKHMVWIAFGVTQLPQHLNEAHEGKFVEVIRVWFSSHCVFVSKHRDSMLSPSWCKCVLDEESIRQQFFGCRINCRVIISIFYSRFELRLRCMCKITRASLAGFEMSQSNFGYFSRYFRKMSQAAVLETCLWIAKAFSSHSLSHAPLLICLLNRTSISSKSAGSCAGPFQFWSSSILHRRSLQRAAE